ncbi:hypothetical protein D3C74_472480 [compost metagenome]
MTIDSINKNIESSIPNSELYEFSNRALTINSNTTMAINPGVIHKGLILNCLIVSLNEFGLIIFPRAITKK